MAEQCPFIYVGETGLIFIVTGYSVDHVEHVIKQIFNLITFLTGSRTCPLDAWFYGTCPPVYQIGEGFLSPNPMTI